jgi:hypothetical protein
LGSLAVLNSLWIPIVYYFFHKTAGLKLEDIDLVSEKGGITGGVSTSRGRTVTRHQHARIAGVDEKIGAETVGEEVSEKV